ncbi:MAG: HupE/UreJ family protein, partial [Betaproteobacteria bacterium]
ALTEVLWVVTAFTVAHSITLTLAALQIVELPSRLVESAIAASVVLAAANNLWPVVERRRWLVAFSFGLIHGFGFASVLTELGLPKDALVLSLLGFNLGVETGQLAIVAGFLPVAFLLRNTPLYRKGVFILGSVFTMLVALVWLVERAFNLKLITA